MTNQNFKIGLVQTACSGDRGSNIVKTSAFVDEAGSKGAKIVCLQEVFGTRYFPQTINIPQNNGYQEKY